MNEYSLLMIYLVIGFTVILWILLILQKRLAKKPPSNEEKIKGAIKEWIKEETDKDKEA